MGWLTTVFLVLILHDSLIFKQNISLNDPDKNEIIFFENFSRQAES